MPKILNFQKDPTRPEKKHNCVEDSATIHTRTGLKIVYESPESKHTKAELVRCWKSTKLKVNSKPHDSLTCDQWI